VKIYKSKINEYLVIFLFTMLCFGYIISAFLPVFFNLNTTPFNVAFRAMYLGLSVYLILVGIDKYTFGKFKWNFWVVFIFIAFYSSRIFYDVFIEGIVFKDSIINLMLFTYGGNFIPFVAIAIFANRLDYNKLLDASFIVLFISGILTFLLLYKIIGGLSMDLFRYRLSFSTDDGGNDVINPITVSLYGTLLSLISLYYILFKRHISKAILMIGFVLGFALLLFGASRGPQVTYFLCAFYILFAYLFFQKKSVKQKFRVGMGFGGFFMFLIVLISQIDLEKIAMYNRFANFGKDASSDTSARERNWSVAWNSFLDGPLIGDCYVINYFGVTYPHNIYIEVLMATGIIGGALFLTILLSLLFRIPKNNNQVAIYALFLVPVFSGLFSGSLFFNPLLFSMFALMVAFPYINGKSLKTTT